MVPKKYLQDGEMEFLGRQFKCPRNPENILRFWYGDTWNKPVGKFEKTGADFVYGDGIYVHANSIDKVVRYWVGGSYHRWKVRLGWLPLHPTCYIRRDVMLREGLYDESYRIAADTELLVRYLYKARLKVAYMKRLVIRMRMGGLSTDSEKRRQMWDEDIRLYKAHGFAARSTKLMKMMWKVPQFIRAFNMHSYPE